MNYDLVRELLRKHEGLRLREYRCPAGKRSIGYGWNLEANALPIEIAAYFRLHGAITEAMATWLLNVSIDMAERQCRGIFDKWDEFSDNRKMALIDFVFNVGVGTALKFKKAMAAILAGDWSEAADEMQDSKWFRQVGNRGPEIVEMIRHA